MDNRNYLITFTEEFGYPEEAKGAFLQAYDMICGDDCRKASFEAILRAYQENANCDYPALLEQIHELSEKAGVHHYIGTTMLYICMAQFLRDHYEAAGYTEEMWRTMMYDLLYKVRECKSVYDMWGIFPQNWYFGIFAMRRFAFCKLQFDLGTFGAEYEKDGLVLTPESKAVNVHIPNTGTPLDVESKDKSYRMAAEFYQKEFGDGPVIFTCNSWLLFPRNREILKPASNIIAFLNDYEEVHTEEYEDYACAWRMFGVMYEGDVDKLPQNNSLQRGYADWIRKGEKFGHTKGVIVYDLQED